MLQSITFTGRTAQAAFDGHKTQTRRFAWRRIDGPAKTPWQTVKVGDRLAVRESRFMPSRDARMALVITATRIERLHDIGDADAHAEGAFAIYGEPLPGSARSARRSFELLWRHLHGDDGWDRNPEVVVLSFRVEKC